MLLKHLYALRIWLGAILGAFLLHGWGLFSLQKYLQINVPLAPIEVNLSVELHTPKSSAPSSIAELAPQQLREKSSKALSRAPSPSRPSPANMNSQDTSIAASVKPTDAFAVKMNTSSQESSSTAASASVTAAAVPAVSGGTGQVMGNSNHNLSASSPGVELPSSSANYLNNPKPRYPPTSLRLEEQGRVVVHVLIGTDGLPLKMEIRVSSGFDRLDKAALDAVSGWRFTPGSRGGVAEAMWVDVPLVFKIN